MDSTGPPGPVLPDPEPHDIWNPGCAWFHGMNKREKEAYEEERLQEKREKHFLLCYLTIV